MTELFLYDRQDSLFKSLLAKSATIKGNYHVSPDNGQDLNSANLDSFFKDSKYGLADIKKYPIAVCMTPVSGFVQVNGNVMEQFFFRVFFLQKANTDAANQVRARDKDTNLSASHPWKDWSQMKKCASDFVHALEKVVRTKYAGSVPLRSIINLDVNRAVVKRIHRANNDSLNGVSLSFIVNMITDSCTISDYPNDFLDTLTLPTNGLT